MNILLHVYYIAALNHGKRVFIEHRAADYPPDEFMPQNSQSYLQNVIEHVRLFSEVKLSTLVICEKNHLSQNDIQRECGKRSDHKPLDRREVYLMGWATPSAHSTCEESELLEFSYRYTRRR